MKPFRLALFALLSPIAAQAQQMLTLEDAIQQGITKQYSIQISRQKERIASNENSLGNAGFLPTITGTATKNYTPIASTANANAFKITVKGLQNARNILFIYFNKFII